jgi:hypothetical protein
VGCHADGALLTKSYFGADEAALTAKLQRLHRGKINKGARAMVAENQGRC